MSHLADESTAPPMRLVHVVPHIDDEASGPSYSVPRLCQALARHGHDVRLVCLASSHRWDGVTVEVHRQWPLLARFAISPSLARALSRHAASADVVHNHSLWSMANVAAGWAVPARRARLVTSPRGTLSPWALGHSRWVKRALWPLQRRALSRADLIHATSDTEYQEIRALGFKAPVAIVPNGVDVPEAPSRIDTQGGGRTLLFLSRIHPKKGIDRLLRVWAQLQHSHPDWSLVIAGRGETVHEQQALVLAQALGVQRVEFPGPLYGEDKAAAYRAADLFVLPTHSENFAMVVAEALAHGCPAIVSRGAPWDGLETQGCGWWVDNDDAALAGALDAAMGLAPDARAAMGEQGRQWMRRDYGWDAVAGRMALAYRWLLEGGAAPAWIRTD